MDNISHIIGYLIIISNISYSCWGTSRCCCGCWGRIGINIRIGELLIILIVIFCILIIRSLGAWLRAIFTFSWISAVVILVWWIFWFIIMAWFISGWNWDKIGNNYSISANTILGSNFINDSIQSVSVLFNWKFFVFVHRDLELGFNCSFSLRISEFSYIWMFQCLFRC